MEPESLLRLVLTLSVIPVSSIVAILVYLYKNKVAKIKALREDVTELEIGVAKNSVGLDSINNQLSHVDEKIDKIIDRLIDG